MAEVKVRGIVVSEAAMGDQDKRIVLLTREMGKVTVLVKGALSPKSRHRAVAQLFCCGQYVLSKGRTFYYIKEAELKESFYELRTDLVRLAWAGLMVETAADGALDGQENHSLLDLLLRGLVQIKQGADPVFIASVFLMRFLSDNGFSPDLSACVCCGRQEGEEGDWGFLAAEGGLVCPDCLRLRTADQLLSPTVRYALQYITAAPEEKVYRFQVNEEIVQELRQAVIRYLQTQVGTRYAGLGFIKKLEENNV